MTGGLRTFLTFQGGAATAALDLYRDVFDDFELIDIDHYGAEDSGPAGTVKVARFRLAGSDLSCADSPVDHAWNFTPAVSLWIDCDERTSSSACSIGSARAARCSCRRRLRVQLPFRLGR